MGLINPPIGPFSCQRLSVISTMEVTTCLFNDLMFPDKQVYSEKLTTVQPAVQKGFLCILYVR